MVYDRSDRSFGREPDYTDNYGDTRANRYTSGREYRAAGEYRDERGDPRGRGYGADDDRRSRGGYGATGGHNDAGSAPSYHGSYASDGHRFEDVGRNRHLDDDNYRGRQPEARRPDRDEDRGFFARVGDEVRSWLGDDEAERRRDGDARDGRARADRDRDDDYHSWRSGQIAALDRDYHEYRTENRGRFHDEFTAWRTSRQGQRDQLTKVREHMDVVGSDGEHVGTVDKVRGDRILLTKNDVDAGGHHHSIPSRWIASVEDTVVLEKTGAEAKRAWKDEEERQALADFGDRERDRSRGYRSDR